jgi:hypothetical protein
MEVVLVIMSILTRSRMENYVIAMGALKDASQ